MKGHLVERSPGHFAIVLDIRDPETGRRKRKWHSFKGTKRAAQNECARLIAAVNGGSYSEPSKLKLGGYLETWLESVQTQLAPRTFERYADIVRKNLNPLLGGAVLTALKPVTISAAYAKALQSGRRDGSGGLSAATVLYMHRVLRHALRQAVIWDMLARNPADRVAAPRVERKQMNALDADQTARLLAHFRPTRMFVPVLLGSLGGLRRGEIAALKWKHVDLTVGRMSVVESIEQTSQGTRAKGTKSGRGRVVALPSLVVEELARHRVRQAEELLKIGVRQNGDTLLVLREDGEPLKPSSLPTGSPRSSPSPICPASGFTICGIRTPRICCRRAFTPRSRKSGLGTRPWASRSTSIRTCFPACRRTPRARLTWRSGPP